MILVITAASLSTSAFTAASVDRSANIDVVADQNGLLALTDGTSGPLVYYNDEQLAIDFAQGTATGANVDAEFVLGDANDSKDEHAFTVTNNDGEAHDVSVQYVATQTDSNDDDNVEFVVFDADGDAVATLSEETDAQSFSAGAGETFYVVVTVDTGHGVSEVLGSGDDLSGTLSFTVDDNAA
ncbi:hypothetical protein C440_05947 [Haloferax mucosum ATCC BAA-1512]|uniref:Uncharacterized protein n=1 Tax=Haloferax mucosum ATCC BAA-1512 TaxID=662479 RepID=M0IIW6_9EURY|nr:hypothetical protein C440_05947 [Haloferax mucosum ATCC BAA-1512]